MSQAIQVPCPACRQMTWAYPGTTMPCTYCRAPVMGPPQGYPPPPPQQQHAAPAIKVGGFSVPISAASARSPVKLIGIVVLALVVGIGGYLVKSKFTTPKGTLSYGSLGVDGSKPLADDLYRAPSKDAKKWKSDATFWSFNFHAVRMDGTVDLSKPAVIEYVSPSNSASTSKKTRSSSLRKYTAQPKGLKTSIWGWNEPVKNLEPHPSPTCTIKQLLAKLSAEGVIKTPTVRVMFDPKFADFYAWTLYIDGAPKPLSFSWETCAPIK